MPSRPLTQQEFTMEHWDQNLQPARTGWIEGMGLDGLGPWDSARTSMYMFDPVYMLGKNKFKSRVF